MDKWGQVTMFVCPHCGVLKSKQQKFCPQCTEPVGLLSESAAQPEIERGISIEELEKYVDGDWDGNPPDSWRIEQIRTIIQQKNAALKKGS